MCWSFSRDCTNHTNKFLKYVTCVSNENFKYYKISTFLLTISTFRPPNHHQLSQSFNDFHSTNSIFHQVIKNVLYNKKHKFLQFQITIIGFLLSIETFRTPNHYQLSQSFSFFMLELIHPYHSNNNIP